MASLRTPVFIDFARPKAFHKRQGNSVGRAREMTCRCDRALAGRIRRSTVPSGKRKTSHPESARTGPIGVSDASRGAAES